MDKKTLCEWADKLEFAKIFEELDNQEVKGSLLEALRNEYIAGQNNIDYVDRLKVFIVSLKDTTNGNPLQICVLTASKNQIEKTGRKWRCRLPTSRYDDENLKNWQVFEKPESIETILNEYEQRSGFPINVIYIQNVSLDKEGRQHIREVRQDLILIADMFAVCDENKSFVQYFNHQEIGGLLVPVCPSYREKTQNLIWTTIKETFQDMHDDFTNFQKECLHIAFGITSKEWLFRCLTHIARLHLKITNQIQNEPTENKELRDLNFGFSS